MGATYNRRMTLPQVDSDDPIEVFDAWLHRAIATEPNDPNAMALATCTADGRPSVRMVLAKRVGSHRFAFFTNAESRKGGELAANPRAALCFYWKTLRRQVRVEGPVRELDSAAVDEYFRSRSRDSQIGAAVSEQSRILASREVLEERFAAYAAEHADAIPRPAYWRGFYVEPERIEFWLAGDHRLHNRFLFTREGDSWQRVRLFP
jgi:pyridoxamine 5'-phosphate oxidase